MRQTLPRLHNLTSLISWQNFLLQRGDLAGWAVILQDISFMNCCFDRISGSFLHADILTRIGFYLLLQLLGSIVSLIGISFSRIWILHHASLTPMGWHPILSYIADPFDFFRFYTFEIQWVNFLVRMNWRHWIHSLNALVSRFH